MEKLSLNETISFENFQIESDNHKLHNITIKNQENNSLYILSFYQEENLFSIKYEKTFSLENLKNIAYFSLFNSIKEIYEEIIYLIKQKQKEIKILENSNGLIIKIPLEGLKFKEITLNLDEKKEDEKQTIKNLYSIIKNLINKNNILENNQAKLEEKLKNLENDMKELKEYVRTKNEKIYYLDSLIIKDHEKYHKAIKNWINPKSNIKAELLYRLSNNGNQYEKFHELCDNKGNTLLIIQLTDGNILGGFTSQNWDNSSSWKKDNKSFVFSLTKLMKADNNSEETQIFCHHIDRGPCFGFFLYFYAKKMDELEINKNCNKFLGCNKLFDGENQYYKVLEVEVFKIIFE